MLLSFVKCFKLPGSQNGSHSGVIALLFLTYVMYIWRTFLWDKFNVSHFYKFDNTKTQRNVSKFQQRRHKRTATSMHRGACVVSQSVESDSLWPCRLQPTRLPSPWDAPGKNTGVGCHSLLQEIFPNQGSNLGLLLCVQILHCLSQQGGPSNKVKC